LSNLPLILLITRIKCFIWYAFIKLMTLVKNIVTSICIKYICYIFECSTEEYFVMNFHIYVINMRPQESKKASTYRNNPHISIPRKSIYFNHNVWHSNRMLYQPSIYMNIPFCSFSLEKSRWQSYVLKFASKCQTVYNKT